MLKIGWSIKDVSTDLPVVLPGQFHMRVSEGLLDSMSVTALTLAGEDDYVIFLCCDLVGVEAGILNEIRAKAVKLNPAIDPLKIVMHITHTHCGPQVKLGEGFGTWGEIGEIPLGGFDVASPAKYKDFFTDSAAAAIAESFANQAEGSVSYGYGYAVVAHSRRVVYFDNLSERDGASKGNSLMINGHAQMYGKTNDDMFSHYEAGADHFANFLFTFDKDEKLTGAIVNIPCPSQNSEQEWLLTSDYWHDVKEELKKRYGDIYVLPQCAAAGDLSPRILHYREAQARRYRMKYADFQPDPRVRGPEELINRKDIAERICAAFDEVYSWASKEKYTDLPLVHSVKTVQLDRRIVTDEEYEFCCREKEKQLQQQNYITEGEPAQVLHHNTVTAAGTRRYDNVIARYKTQKENPKYPMEMHVIKLGEIAFATNQFELYMDYQHRIQARSPFTQTFVVQLTAQPDDRAGSYLCTERGQWGMGYSATVFCNKVSPSGGQQLVEETLKELNRIF